MPRVSDTPWFMGHLGTRQWDHLQSVNRDGWFGPQQPPQLLPHLPSFPSLLSFTVVVVTQGWSYLQPSRRSGKASKAAISRRPVGWQWHPAFNLQHGHSAVPCTFTTRNTVTMTHNSNRSQIAPGDRSSEVASAADKSEHKMRHRGWRGFALRATGGLNICANPKAYSDSYWYML